MSRITGFEQASQVPAKVRLIYDAVMELIEEGTDVTGIRVSAIAERAGIGKGTAYEYFDTKEEIVACTIIYQMQRVFSWLEEALCARESFGEQLNFLLDEMGKKDGRKYCFLRFVHILTDNSDMSKLVREKVEAEGFAAFRPQTVFGKILQQGVERGDLRKDLPLDYMVYCVFSHLLTYMMGITAEDGYGMRSEDMRPLVYRGIMGELETR